MLLICGRCRVEQDPTGFAPSQRRNGGWCRDCYRAWYVARSGGMADRACDACGVVMRVTARRSKEARVYCSRACKDARRNAELARERLAVKAAAPERRCVHCGQAIPAGMRADARFCSEQCNSAAHQVTRKMAARVGVPRPGRLVSRAYIAGRDRWRCGVCGGRVPKGRRHPHPMSASIDHIIPIAHGGGNGPENLRLVHLRCNLSRRDTATNDQLMLVG